MRYFIWLEETTCKGRTGVALDVRSQAIEMKIV